MIRVAMIAVIAIVIGAKGLAVAEAGTLDKIRQAETITLGHPETSIPFAYLDADQKPVGYTLDICRAVAEELKANLGLTKLEIRYNPVTSATRIPLVANGTVDLECGNTTNLLDRHKYVSFAPTTFVAQGVIISRKGGDVDPNDLKTFRGKTIVAQAGSIFFKLLSQASANEKLGITLVTANDLAQAFLMMENGRAQGCATDDGLAYALVAAAREPNNYVISTKGLDRFPYAIMLPRGDEEYKKQVDAAVRNLIQSGKVAQLYEKYFNSPIPPHNINLNYPMSEPLKRALEKPTDSSNAADYQ